MSVFWRDFAEFAKEEYEVNIVYNDTGPMRFDDLFPDIAEYLSVEEATKTENVPSV